MARTFTPSSSDNLQTGALTLASSGTMAGWYRPNFAPGGGVIRFWFDTVTTNDAPSFQRFNDNNFYVGFTNAGNTRIVVADTGLFSSGVWAHFAFTWTSSLQTFYVNGVSKGTQAFTFSSPGSLARTIGHTTVSNSDTFDGSIADFAIWNVALTVSELLAISKGARPLNIRPMSLQIWYPITGLQSPEPDLSTNANNGTVTGTHTDFGPPIMEFTPRWRHNIPFNVAAGQSFQPAWAIKSRIVVDGIGI